MSTTIGQLRRQPEKREELLHQGIVLGAGILAGVAVRRLLAAVWIRRDAHGRPPRTPGVAGVSWKEATIWAVSSSVAAGISRMVAQRLAEAVARPVTARAR